MFFIKKCALSTNPSLILTIFIRLATCMDRIVHAIENDWSLSCCDDEKMKCRWEWELRMKGEKGKKMKFPYYELAHGCMINWNNLQTMLHEMQWLKEITQQIDVSSKKNLHFRMDGIFWQTMGHQFDIFMGLWHQGVNSCNSKESVT